MPTDYRIEGVLAEGPDGPVHRATALRLGARPVALRRLPLPAGPCRDRLRTAAEVVARTGHAGLVVVDDIVEVDEETVLIATPIAEGGSLADRLVLGPLPVREATEVVEAVADALAAAHGAGLTHRALHPRNVVLTARGPAVTDLAQSGALGRPSRSGDPVVDDVTDLARIAAGLIGPADRSLAAEAYRQICSELLEDPSLGLGHLVRRLRTLADEPAPTPRPGAFRQPPVDEVVPSSATVALVVAVATVVGVVLGAAGTLLPALGA